MLFFHNYTPALKEKRLFYPCVFVCLSACTPGRLFVHHLSVCLFVTKMFAAVFSETIHHMCLKFLHCDNHLYTSTRLASWPFNFVIRVNHNSLQMHSQEEPLTPGHFPWFAPCDATRLYLLYSTSSLQYA